MKSNNILECPISLNRIIIPAYMVEESLLTTNKNSDFGRPFSLNSIFEWVILQKSKIHPYPHEKSLGNINNNLMDKPVIKIDTPFCLLQLKLNGTDYYHNLIEKVQEFINKIKVLKKQPLNFNTVVIMPIIHDVKLILKFVTKKHPNDPYAYYLLGEIIIASIKFSNQKPEEIKSLYQEAVNWLILSTNKAKSTLPLHVLANTYFEIGRFEQSEVCFEKISKVHPNDALLYYNYSLACYKQGKKQKSMCLVRRAQCIVNQHPGLFNTEQKDSINTLLNALSNERKVEPK